METEDKDINDKSMGDGEEQGELEQEVGKNEDQEPEGEGGSEYVDITEEERELREELNNRLERERQLLLLLQQKEKQAKTLAKRYDKLKEELWSKTKEDKTTQKEVEIDMGLVREIMNMKDKIKDKNQKLELLERDLDSHNKNQEMDKMYHKHKNLEEFNNYQKLCNENPHLETYLRSEYYKSSLDKIQALKQLAEQLSFEVERANVVKAELEENKSKYDAYLKQTRAEFKKLQDENEKLAEEADKRKNSL